MESGLYLSLFSSWEMIAVCIFLILLLPLVFFIASTAGRRRVAPRTRKVVATPTRGAPEPEPDEEEPQGRDSPRGRAVDEDPEEDA